MSTQLAKKYSNITWTEVDNLLLSKCDLRLDASFYHIDGLKAKEIINNLKVPKKTITGTDGIALAYHRPRFKRIFLEKSDFPIYQPGQISEVHPQPTAYISKKTLTDIEALRVKTGQILLTCSGTTGKTTIVGRTLGNNIFSHDLIRITTYDTEYAGYLYAYLKSDLGNTILLTNNYGAVVSHIEPKHLESIYIPILDKRSIQKIHKDIIQAFSLRDQANNLIDESQELFYKLLDLPKISEEDVQCLGDKKVKTWEINEFGFEKRFDGSFYYPLADLAIEKLKESKHPISTLADKELIEKVFIPGRFKRIYVNKKFGIPFLSGKNITQMQPGDLKYLARSKTKNLDNYIIKKDWILITCSGTIGRTALVTSEWNGWTATQHILRVVPKNINTGYLYVFLSSDYGQVQIKRFIHGSVVDEITDRQISQVVISIPDLDIQKQIGEKAQKAFELRAKANEIEEKAIKFLEEKIKESTN